MKIYQIKTDDKRSEIITVDTFGNKYPEKEADKIVNLLIRHISSHTFSIVIRRLKSGGYIKCK